MEENPEIAECVKEKDDAFETLNKDQAEYDKQLLALSAAFLGVALAFVKDVVPLKDAVYLWEFDTALALLFGCVCVVLGTFQYSIHSHFHLVDYWDKRKELLEAPEEGKALLASKQDERWAGLKRKASRIKVLNLSSIVLFVAGTIFLIVFVGTNLQREAHSVPKPAESSAKPIAPCDAGKPAKL